jgi:hypothetical protein
VKVTAVLTAAALLALVGCASLPGPASESGAVPAMPVSGYDAQLSRAERIESEVELLGLQMGRMVLDFCPADSLIRTTIEASPLVRLVRRLSGTATTYLSGGGLTPERSSVEVHDGDKTRTYRIEYTGTGFEYEYETIQGKVERGHHDGAAGAPLYDLQSSMSLLRTWRPRLGEAAHFYVVLGRHLWRAEARFAGPEMLTVSGSPRLTRRVDGVASRVDTDGAPKEGEGASDTRRAFSLWFDHDGAGYPVRLVAKSTYGDVSMSLARYVQSDEFCLARREAEKISARPADRGQGGLNENPSTGH